MILLVLLTLGLSLAKRQEEDQKQEELDNKYCTAVHSCAVLAIFVFHAKGLYLLL